MTAPHRVMVTAPTADDEGTRSCEIRPGGPGEQRADHQVKTADQQQAATEKQSLHLRDRAMEGA